MMLFEQLATFFEIIGGMISDPVSVAILFGWFFWVFFLALCRA
jgi:hypothetical protein